MTENDTDAKDRFLAEALNRFAFDLLYPGMPYPDLVLVHVPKPSEADKKDRRMPVNLFISPTSALDKDKLQ